MLPETPVGFRRIEGSQAMQVSLGPSVKAGGSLSPFKEQLAHGICLSKL